jgi:hypothetical protein
MSHTLPNGFGSSVVGALHERDGLPCQDAYAMIRVEPDTLVVAVADGLGSARHSAHGSGTAARIAAESVAAGLRSGINADPSELAEAGIVSARLQLEQEAEALGCELRDLGTTRLVAIAVQQMLVAAQIGDGAVVANQPQGAGLVMPPTENEYTNEVDPLTMNDWHGQIRVSALWPECNAFAVFTDGCQRAALQRANGDWRAFPGFFRPLFSFARTVAAPEDGEIALRELLESDKVCANCDDDKTLVIGVLNA